MIYFHILLQNNYLAVRRMFILPRRKGWIGGINSIYHHGVVERICYAKFSTLVPIIEPTYERKMERPSIKPDIFTRKVQRMEGNFSALPLDTYPNPLLKLSKEEILDLDRRDYLHLLQLPYRSDKEIESFCYSIIQMLKEILMSNTKKAIEILIPITDDRMKNIILSALEKHFERGIVQKSILSYLRQPESASFRKCFFETITKIISDKGGADQQEEILLNYLKLLSMTRKINRKAIVLNLNFFERVISIISREKHAEFFTYLVTLNIQTYVPQRLYPLKRELITGSNLERFVAKTGWLNSKWHDINRSDFDEEHKQRMVLFYSTRDLNSFTNFAIKEKDVVDATFYLDLLVRKFELKTRMEVENPSEALISDTTLEQDIDMTLNTILCYVITFKGPEASVSVLKFMKNNKLNITSKTYLTIIRSLRLQGYSEVAITVTKQIDLSLLKNTELTELAEEILVLMIDKFPHSPKIAIGYASAMFGAPDINGNDLLTILNDLNLLSTAYRGEMTSTGVSFKNKVQMANVDERLTNLKPTPVVLRRIYEIIFDNFNCENLTPKEINNYYNAYVNCLVNSNGGLREMKKKRKRRGHVFDPLLMNDDIITLLIKYLLKDDPKSSDMNISSSPLRFDIAKRITKDFSSKVNIKRYNRKPYLYELLITASLLVHNDYAFASEMIRECRSSGLPFTFNQMYPFIIYYYRKGEFDKARLWYDTLVKNGVKATAEPAKTLFKIARELHWKVNGFVYRKLRIHKNYKKREQLEALKNEPFELALLLSSSNNKENKGAEFFGSSNSASLGDILSLFVVSHKASEP